MEYVKGITLHDRLRDGPLPLDEVLRIGACLADGLAAAHTRGLVHGDIKPGNILLEHETGREKITDFGLAQTVDEKSFAHDGIVAGTPEYMSPEQARGEAVDHRSDLFSLGSVLYAMCTGAPPLAAKGIPARLKRCQGDYLPVQQLRPDLPDSLADLIHRLIAERPYDRPQTATAIAQELNACLRRPSPHRWRLDRRHLLVAVVASCAAAVMMVTSYSHMRRFEGRQITSGAPQPTRQPIAAATNQPPRVLAILASEGFHYPDYRPVREQLEKAGVQVVVATTMLGPARPEQAKIYPAVQPDLLLSNARGFDYQAICFCGGSGVKEFISPGPYAAEARRVITEALVANRYVTALGRGPLVLADAGALEGVNATCFHWHQPPGVIIERLESAGAQWVDEPVVASGLIITGRDPDHAAWFAAKLVERLGMGSPRDDHP